MGQGFIAPQIDEYSRPFWEGAANGMLQIQACAACGRRRFPPRPMCPYCQSMATEWHPMSGRGSIWSYIIPHPPLLEEFGDLPGFNAVVVALEEDESMRLIGNLVTDPDAPINSVDPEDIKIGAAVQVVFPEVAPGVRVIRWVAV